MIERSEKLFEQAKNVMPGGVSSPARAFKSVGGTPVFFERAEGSWLYDVDGNRYIDYVASWGPMILGHAHPPVIEAVTTTAMKSTSFGAPTEVEMQFCELLTGMVPGVEKVRMVNSGTEACMSAIRLARGYTGKDKVIKFSGCYHGHGDSFLIKAGSSALTLGHPDSPGVTAGTARDTLTARYNDAGSVRRLLEENPGQVAAVIIEPVAGNMGCVPPEDGFLQELRRLCNEHGTLLIFDEVMCGFRVAPGGAQERYRVQADLVTFGKIIGAGMPVGAYAGRAELMDRVSPAGPVNQGGTLSGNPVAMAAGYTLVSELYNNPEIYTELDDKAARLEQGFREIFSESGRPFTINRVGSMLSVFFTDQTVRDFESATTTDLDYFKRYFHAMLEEGVYLPPSNFEALFISRSLDEEMIDRTLEAARNAVRRLQADKSNQSG